MINHANKLKSTDPKLLKKLMRDLNNINQMYFKTILNDTIKVRGRYVKVCKMGTDRKEGKNNYLLYNKASHPPRHGCFLPVRPIY